MSNSLFDQLKKSGLVNDKQARQTKQSQYQSQKQQKGKNKPAPQADETKQLAQQTQAEKLERDRQLNQQRKEESERRAVVAQIKQLIESNRVIDSGGDISYHFTDGNVVKRLYLNANIHKELSHGRLAIAKLNDRYELVPPIVADKIRERDASQVIYCGKTVDNVTPEDDPYAAYKVPDDLMW